MPHFKSVAEALAAFDPWPWTYFHPRRDKRIACQGTGELLVVPEFFSLMDRLRKEFGRPIIVNSWYRSAEYNALISKTGPAGPHTKAAVDIAIYGALALELANIAFRLGFTGFGWKQHGPHRARFLHLDTLGDRISGPRPWIWTYP